MGQGANSEGQRVNDVGQTFEKELRTKAIDAALEWSKQITTITTGALILSGTFIKIFMDANPMEWKWVILTSWISMGVSIIFGFLYLGALCSLLDCSARNNNLTTLDIYESPGKWIAIVHVIAFFVGLATFIAFIFKNL